MKKRVPVKKSFGGAPAKKDSFLLKKQERLDKELEGYWIKNKDTDTGRHS